MSALNNNYFMKLCEDIPGLTHPYAEGHRRLEECRWSWEELTDETGVGTDDILRRVGDFGLQHYWSSHHPWVVPEPMTIEPCETFSKEDLEEYSEVLRTIAAGGSRGPGAGQDGPAQVRHPQALGRGRARRPDQVGDHLAGLPAQAREGVTPA